MATQTLGVNPPKGFRDVLPQETQLRDSVLSTILDIYRSYGFERVETPAVEDLRRLQHSDGGENLGLLFKILKRGEKLDLASAAESPDNLTDLALRYDLTVPLSRYYAAHRAELPPVFKAVQVGPVFRAERPQQGRFRQFVQCDIDVIGGCAPLVETELITVTSEALCALGLTGIQVRINDRRILNAMMTYAGIDPNRIAHALVLLDKLDKLGVDGVRSAFLEEEFPADAVGRLLDFAAHITSIPSEQRLEATATMLGTSLSAEVVQELRSIIDGVSTASKVQALIYFDPFLVRGMGYYTGAVFEVVHPQFSGSVAGGGRYDKLVGKLSGTDAPACGFSIGFERIITILMQAAAQKGAASSREKIALFVDSGAPIGAALQAVKAAQENGTIVSLFESPKNMKHTLERLKLAGYTGFARFQGEPILTIKPVT
jgi:histidyl-tRNA synthetase